MTKLLELSAVRIFDAAGRNVVGAGFLVDEGMILTCAHVVAGATDSSENSPTPPEASIPLDLPLVAPGQRLTARVIRWVEVKPDGGGDIAVLQLEGTVPTAAKIARLVKADNHWEHRFRAFGFPHNQDDGVPSSGKLSGPNAKGWVVMQNTEATGFRVQRGFSGGAVWDTELDGVAGMVVAEETDPAPRIAYMIPSKLLIDVWPALSQQAIPPCPYRGLAAFREQDAPYFFGRDADTRRLVEAIHRKPLVALIGASGSGKSSLVFAGLLPHLHKEGSWAIAPIFRPGNAPLLSLAASLTPLLEPTMSERQQIKEAEVLAQDLREGMLFFPKLLERVVQKNNANRLLITVDQFEELYTLCQDKEERQSFLDALLAITQMPTSQRSYSIAVVCTLRADFMGQALSYAPLTAAMQEAILLIGPMSRAEQEAAIKKPAERLHVQIEGGLTKHILNEVGQDTGQLPLLEFALTQLWARQHHNILTHASYEEIGSVKKALSDHAEAVYADLNEEERQEARHIFIALVRPGDGTEDTRRVTTRTQLSEARWPLVTRLADERLVVTGHDITTGQETVEVIHEALIRGWQRLRGWIDSDREFLAWLERLRSALRQWENKARNPGALLHGILLGEALDWLSQRSNALSEAEGAFICASQEEERREREHLQGLLEESERQRQIALARGLAAQSELILTHHPRLFERSCLLAVEAMQRFPSLEANQAVRKSIGMLRRHLATLHLDGSVLAVTFSPDGRYLATASDDGTAALWDIARGRRLVTLRHNKAVEAVAFSPDGRYLATGSDDGTAVLWDIVRDERLVTLRHEKEVEAVAFSPDGRYLATGSDDGTAVLWDKTNGKRLIILHHNKAVEAVTFSPDGRYLATACMDGTAMLWERTSGECLVTLRHNKAVEAVAFGPDGRYLATGSDDGTAVLWDKTNGKRLVTLRHEEEVQGVAFSPDGSYLATACMDGTAMLWETSTGKRLAILNHEEEVQGVAFSPNGNCLATASNDRTVVLWDILGGGHLALLRHENLVGGVAFSPDGHFVATASQDNTAVLWETTSGKCLTTLQHEGSVGAVAFSPDGQLVATASADGTAVLWEPASGKRFVTLQHDEWVRVVAFSLDGQLVATASNDHTAVLWSATSGKRLATLQHEEWVRVVAFSPDGQLVATASADGSTTLWDVVRGERLVVLRQEGLVTAITFSPDGRCLATAGWGGSATLWDVARSESLVTLQHSSAVRAVAFSPDGRLVATASADGTAMLWETASGKRLATLQHEGSVGAVVFSPDGRFVATASQDNTAALWLWRPADLIAEAQARLKRNLTLDEWQQYIGDEPYRKTFPSLP
jgi:WD40 repeat protein